MTRETADDGELSDDEQRAIALAVIDVRPEWHSPGIEAQIRQVAHLPASVVLPAFVEAAGDRRMNSPINLASAAQEIAAREQAREVAAVRREHDAEDWRRTVHEDAENRATADQRTRGASAARQALRSKKREVAHARPIGG